MGRQQWDITHAACHHSICSLTAVKFSRISMSERQISRKSSNLRKSRLTTPLPNYIPWMSADHRRRYGLTHFKVRPGRLTIWHFKSEIRISNDSRPISTLEIIILKKAFQFLNSAMEMEHFEGCRILAAYQKLWTLFLASTVFNPKNVQKVAGKS